MLAVGAGRERMPCGTCTVQVLRASLVGQSGDGACRLYFVLRLECGLPWDPQNLDLPCFVRVSDGFGHVWPGGQSEEEGRTDCRWKSPSDAGVSGEISPKTIHTLAGVGGLCVSSADLKEDEVLQLAENRFVLEFAHGPAGFQIPVVQTEAS